MKFPSGRSLLTNVFKPSTLAFTEEARRTPGYTRFDWLHGQVYGRWPYLYIGIGTGEHRLSKVVRPIVGFLARLLSLGVARRKTPDESGQAVDPERVSFADAYHGKVMPLESATRLVTVNEAIRLPDLEHVIPYNKARALILQHPDHIVVLECPCRTARQNPCLPLAVCLIIGEPFASFVAEHHPQRARWIEQAEAVEILKAEDERGHVHHAFFKDAMLDRFYAICNCCSCCCGAMQAHRNGTPMLASSGYVAQVDEDLCIGCGDCAEFCQFHALSVSDGHAHVTYEACMGCSICTGKCAQDALSMRLDSSRGTPLELYELMEGQTK
jgi:Pyruvate/2-oxoacid:ferredoxin oxidoreductase delta subunit